MQALTIARPTHSPVYRSDRCHGGTRRPGEVVEQSDPAGVRGLTNTWEVGGDNVIVMLRLQLVQNAAALKILLITFKALHGLAPSYIPDLLVPYEPEILR